MSAIRSHQASAAALERGGVDKPRGVENAALQHQRKQLGKAAPPSPALPPAAVVSLGSSAEPVTYTREGRWAGAPSAASASSARAPAAPAAASIPAETAGEGAASVGEGSSVHVNAAAEAAGGGSLEVGDDSSVHINTRGSGGGGTLIVGDNASVHINTRGSGGGGTLIVGDNASVHINTRGSGGGGSLVVADDSSVRINTRAESGAGTLDADAGSRSASAADAGSPPTQNSAVTRPFSASAYLPQRSVDRSASAERSAAADRNAAAVAPSAADLEQDARVSGPRATRRASGTAAPAHLDPRLQMFNQLVDSARQPAASKKGEQANGVDRVKKANGLDKPDDVKTKDAKAADDVKAKEAKEAVDVKADASAPSPLRARG
jgi:hypothetical protein